MGYQLFVVRCVAAVALSIALVACQKSTPQAPAPASAPIAEAAAPPPPKPKTAEDWRRDLLASYRESVVKDEGDGITTFMACFEDAPPGTVNGDGKPVKCSISAFGKRDAFRKMRTYTPTWADIYWRIGNGLGPRIFLPDCGAPTFTLRPYYFSKNGYLMMQRVSVLADGEVALDRDFSREDVHREPEAAGVAEAFTFEPTAAELASLRKLESANQVLVRITGRKGYVSLDKDQAARFVSETRRGLLMLDKLEAATKPNAAAVCP